MAHHKYKDKPTERPKLNDRVLTGLDKAVAVLNDHLMKIDSVSRKLGKQHPDRDDIDRAVVYISELKEWFRDKKSVR